MEDYYEGSLSESDPCPRQMPPLLPPKNLGSKPGTNIRQPPQQQVQSQERQQFPIHRLLRLLRKIINSASILLLHRLLR